MKSPLFAVLALAAGFAGGWIAKPAPAAPPVAENQPAPPPKPAAAKPARPDGTPPPRPAPPAEHPLPPDIPVQTGVLPGGPAAETMEAAKMARLGEVLGLDAEATDKLRKILDDCRKSPDVDPTKPVGPKDTFDHLTKTAATMEKALAELFTPDQAAKFAELRQRERESRVESKAQSALARIAETTDLTKEQREQILTALRRTATEDLDSLPATVSLLASPSVLPLGSAGMPVDSMIELSRLTGPDAPTDNGAMFARMTEMKLARSDAQLAALKPLVSAAQYAQLEAAAAKQRSIRQHILQPPAVPGGNR